MKEEKETYMKNRKKNQTNKSLMDEKQTKGYFKREERKERGIERRKLIRMRKGGKGRRKWWEGGGIQAAACKNQSFLVCCSKSPS